ncbi:MAG: metallopeptidase TldD-related protein [Gammaproteobacteria bacterium]|nr:metallopeptidase TldD-related protein [Gammaproteobacteria bacterium]
MLLERESTSQHRALKILRRSPKAIRPGQYRAYLAPTALAELLDLISHGGFSLREHCTRQSPLLKLATGERQLSPLVTITENRADSLVPLFTEEGFVIPKQVGLIDNGRMAEQLVDPRSAREFDARVNSGSESPMALEMDAGDLAGEDILGALGTGLYINNLWYGNFSDPNNCRITGMTRYACYWVENGEIRAPLEVMRFDDSLYRILGDQLEAITSERRFMHDADTYEQRSLDSMHLPGILCRALRLTL